jgi:multicomponent K+:H+ antiporter subunit G
MSPPAELSLLETIIVSSLLIVGSTFTLIGAVGLLRLKSFYARVHSPTLGTTLGVICIATASMIYFTIVGTRLAVHELIIVVFVTITTPVGLIILVRAALFRDDTEDSQAQRDVDRRPDADST